MSEMTRSGSHVINSPPGPPDENGDTKINHSIVFLIFKYISKFVTQDYLLRVAYNRNLNCFVFSNILCS